MDSISFLRSLYIWDDWGMRRLLDRAQELDPGRLTAPTGMPRGSLWNTLFHVIDAQWIWNQRISGVSPDHHLPEPEHTAQALRELWDQQHAQTMALLDSLAEPELDRVVQYTTTRGVPHELRLGDILLHAGTHAVRHQAEAAQILTDYGLSPGDLDYNLYRLENT